MSVKGFHMTSYSMYILYNIQNQGNYTYFLGGHHFFVVKTSKFLSSSIFLINSTLPFSIFTPLCNRTS